MIGLPGHYAYVVPLTKYANSMMKVEAAHARPQLTVIELTLYQVRYYICSKFRPY